MYGEKWLSIVPLIQVLAVGQLFGPLMGCAGSVYLGCDKAYYGYRLTVARLVLNLILMVTLMNFYGLPGLVWSHIITQSILFPVNLYLVRRLAKFSLWSFVKQLLPAAFSTAVMIGVVLAVKWHLHSNSYWRPWDFHNILPCLAYAIAGLPAYLGTFFLIDRSTVKEAIGLILRKQKKPVPVKAAAENEKFVKNKANN